MIRFRHMAMGTPTSSEWVGRRDASFNLFISLLDQTAGLVKLFFGLNTGATVLFVKILTDSRSPTLVLSALALSILFFAVSAFV